MSASRSVLMPIVLGVTVALATPMSGAGQEGQQGTTADVLVENRAGTDVHVYGLQGGHMVPLGFVEAMANETMRIPSTLVQSGEAIQLVTDLIDSTEWYKSDPLDVRPGNEVHFTIESDLDRSSVTVRE